MQPYHTSRTIVLENDEKGVIRLPPGEKVYCDATHIHGKPGVFPKLTLAMKLGWFSETPVATPDPDIYVFAPFTRRITREIFGSLPIFKAATSPDIYHYIINTYQHSKLLQRVAGKAFLCNAHLYPDPALPPGTLVLDDKLKVYVHPGVIAESVVV